MRCPKCSFISFDHRAACAKCGNNITELSAKLNGTAVDTETPFFLASAIETVGGGGGVDGEDGGAAASFAQTDVDFQLEPDFELSENEPGGGESDGIDMELEPDAPVALSLDADEAGPAAAEEVDFSFDAGPADAEEVDFSFDAEPAAAEEVDISLDAGPAPAEDADLSFDAEPAPAEDGDLSFDAGPAVAEEVGLSLDAEPATAEDADLFLEGLAEPEPEAVDASGAGGTGEPLPQAEADEKTPAAPSGSDFDFDDDILSGLDLDGLDDMEFEGSAENGAAGSDDAYEDLFSDLDLFDDDKELEPSQGEPDPGGSGLSLELGQEKDAESKKSNSPAKKPDIPDLGLTLERDDE